MRIPRHWRLNSQRYALQGVTCPHCSANIFPPREVCPYCEGRTVDTVYEFETQRSKVTVGEALYERAAR
jgi:uncharacterized OB-fold protein